MTSVALLSASGNVGGWLRLRVLRQISPVVTARTETGKPRVIHHRWRPGGEAAGVASIALRNGRNVVHYLAKCVGIDIGATVTRGALASGAGMVHARRPECGEVGVAGVALRRGRDMVAGLTDGRCTVVATRASAVGARIMHIVGRCP